MHFHFGETPTETRRLPLMPDGITVDTQLMGERSKRGLPAVPLALKRQIIVTQKIEGFHAYGDAPQEVRFLRNLHRHLFHVKVGIPVTHNDRDREFFIEQRRLWQVLSGYMADNENAGSCEMIAEHILEKLPHVAWAEVWEDGENGARLERESQPLNKRDSQ